MKKISTIALSLAFALAGSFTGAWAAQSDASVPGEVNAVFQKNCAVCHEGKCPPKKLDLEPGRLPASVVDVTSTEQADLRLIDTAARESSYLLKKILDAEGISGKRMPPPSEPALAQDELAVLENWIMGAQGDGGSVGGRDPGPGP
jgi:mono/diheme cytochrome c family protein